MRSAATGLFSLFCLLAAAFVPAATGENLLFDSALAPPVENLPLKPTRFALGEVQRVTRIETLHWNRGAGSPPGSIALQGRNGELFGPWQASAMTTDGTGGTWWQVRPDLDLPAGRYTVLDSDPATWSRNPQLGSIGIVRIYGVGPDATETTKTTPTPLPLAEQQRRAAELFERLRQVDRFAYEEIERLYLRVINECPDTDEAEEAYFRLSNLYRMGFDPPQYDRLRQLLESFLDRYPDSPGRAEMEERLLRAYENSGQWTQAIAIYERFVPELPADYPYLLVTYLDYANALEGAGQRMRALEVYREVANIAGSERGADFDMHELWLRAANERIGLIELIQDESWQAVAAHYRQRFDDMAWVEMSDIQALLEYAQALEAAGEDASAIEQYRRVLITDRAAATRQGQLARQRLDGLGVKG